MSTTEQRDERRGWAIALLVETGAMLSTSLDPATTVSHVAGLTIPKLADLCVIDLRDEAVRSPNSQRPRRTGRSRGVWKSFGRDGRSIRPAPTLWHG